jgi:hypothetical protein
MLMPRIKRVFPPAAGLAGLFLLAGALAMAQSNSSSAARSDGQIEMDVVHALDSSSALKNDLITAATVKGEVTLTGSVASEASRELAETIVSHISGVVEVKNNLKIGAIQEQAASSDEPSAQYASTDDSSAYDSSAPAAASEDSLTADEPQALSNPSTEARTNLPGRPTARIAQPVLSPDAEPLTLAAGTALVLRTSVSLSSKQAQVGQAVIMTVIQDVSVNGLLAIPRGAAVHAEIVDSKQAGEFSGTPELALSLKSLDLGGKNYPLQANLFRVKGPSKTSQTVGNVVGAGLLGTIIGCAVGKGAGCAVGAGVGVAAGTAISSAQGDAGAWIPAEARVDFLLTEPVTVAPVTEAEAQRLAQGLNTGDGPVLNQRNAPGPRRYVGRRYYTNPAVHYRPYTLEGGFYYWR